jgi:hypothetical protein
MKNKKVINWLHSNFIFYYYTQRKQNLNLFEEALNQH